MSSSEIQPPVAKLVDHTVLFGHVEGENRGPNTMNPPRRINDPLFWLRDDARTDPDVLAHLGRENEYFQAKMEELSDLTETIFQEHLSHNEQTDMSAPCRHGSYLYYTRIVEGQSYKYHCRVPVNGTPGDTKDEQIILNENQLASENAHCTVLHVIPSEDDSVIAYSVDFSGDELCTICFLDAVPNEDSSVNGGMQFQLREERITKTNGEILWGADSQTVFYITRDEAHRDEHAWRRRLGKTQGEVAQEDELIYSETDIMFSVIASKTSDGSLLVVGSVSPSTTELHLLNLRDDAASALTLMLVRPRIKGVRYTVEAHRDTLIILTNDGNCLNNKIVLAPRDDPGVWNQILVPHSDHVCLDHLAVFSDFLVVSGRFNGLTHMWTMVAAGGDFTQQPLRSLNLPNSDPVFCIEFVHAQNLEYRSSMFRVVYSSMATPRIWYDVCPLSHNTTIVKMRNVGDFDSGDYVCKRRFAVAPDQTRIPISLVHRKDLDTSKPQPCMLYAYGAYGCCTEPEFSIAYLPYVNRGVIYAYAHVRGGGEMGRKWYEVEGRHLTKRNTFQDFISCAEELIDANLTTPQQLACEGRSAGGLLIGAVLNMRPDLFACAVAGVPFVDGLTSMCDPSIPYTAWEWEEWGNPNDAKFFHYIKSYCPIENVSAQDYPPIFIHAGLNDTRVGYWEPAKWAAKLRMLKTNHNDVLLTVDMESGHFSASDRYEFWKELARRQAFVIKHLTKRL